MYFDALLVLTKLNLVVIYLHRNDRGDLQKKEKRQREREREWENARVDHDTLSRILYLYFQGTSR